MGVKHTRFIQVEEPVKREDMKNEVHLVKSQIVGTQSHDLKKNSNRPILWWILLCVLFILGAILFFVLRPSQNRYTSVRSVYISGDDVYAVGATCKGTSLTDTPTLWINGTPQVIGEEGNFNKATSVFVSGDDVYVTIREDDNAILWINGSRQVLGKGEANCVFIEGDDVYVGGSSLWKNGVNQYFPGTIEDIQVYKGDCYIAGYIGDYFSSEACIWKNGEPDYLGKGRANSIAISENGDVYVAGFRKTGPSARDKEAVLWKNGIPQVLDGARDDEPYSICVLDDGTVFISGVASVSGAFLWSDGDYLSITEDIIRGPAYSLALSRGRIYVGGESNDAKCPVWYFTPEEHLEQITLNVTGQ